MLSLYLSYIEQLYLFPRQNQASFPSFNDSLTHELIYMTKKKEKDMPLKVSHALRTPRRMKKRKGGNWMSWLRAQGKLRIWRLSIMRTQTSARL